jgi:putative flippase GtrA
MQAPFSKGSKWNRWIRFNSVGIIGILVQLAVLSLLTSLFKLNYLLATGLAVEAAVLNNFYWHENWTWADRAKQARKQVWRRLFYFHIANGALSIIGNIALTKAVVDAFRLAYLQANLIAIAVCSIFNFLAGELLVYQQEVK